MRRKSGKKEERKADAVIVADLHLRDDQPKCRKDDYFETQFEKLAFIADVKTNRAMDGAPLIIAGDVFDHWKPSPLLLARTIDILLNRMKGPILAVAGQHDLPCHNLELIHKSGLGVLEKACGVEVLQNGCSQLINKVIYSGWCWGEIPDWKLINSPSMSAWEADRQVGIFHFPTWNNTNPYHTSIPSGRKRLAAVKENLDLMVVGDNHQCFAISSARGNHLLSPGSMGRQSADQTEHRPSVILYYAKENELKRVYIPVRQDVISREHIEAAEERSKEMQSFVSTLGSASKKGLNYVQALLEQAENQDDPDVTEIIHKAVEQYLEEVR